MNNHEELSLVVGDGDLRASALADQVVRRSYGKLIALLAARNRDLVAAEDALSEAFVSALADWPQNGCPLNPEAWLLTTARRKMIDAGRRRRHEEIAAEQLPLFTDGLKKTRSYVDIPDHRLGLLFVCAHPAIDAGIRSPLMLQAVLGLNAAMIAAAFLVAPTTMGQRLVRAKNKIKEAGIPFRVPEREQLPGRMTAVLDAVYAAFTMGWTEPGGTDPASRDLAGEALHLGKLAAELMPQEGEALGLFALMLHAEARRGARRSEEGEYVPLEEQDTSFWDGTMIDAAESLLIRASAFGTLGRYQLEAALQSAHVYRRRTGHNNWAAVVRLYDALLTLHGSPVVAINRSLAIAETHGADAGLAVMNETAADPRLKDYQPYWAARAQLLAKTGAIAEARRSYEIAIGLERDFAVRRFLRRRESALTPL